jgi:hypothetical protein
MSQIGLEREPLSLSAKGRTELARKLLQSLNELNEVELEALWAEPSAAEIKKVQSTF